MSALRAFVCKCNLMKFVADLHLHSKYSRAVSQQMVLVKMAEWAKYKGINVLATGDFTHPFWFEQLKNELEDTDNGLYRLKAIGDKSVVSGPAFAKASAGEHSSNVYFLLSCEVSSIYSQGGKVRRIHNLFFFPSLSSVEKFNNELLKRGANLRSDGRPIVGISSRDLVEIALGCDEHVLIIPAHIWTPWFSVFGSFSGFDSLSECFGDLVDKIYGIETGLSSDPAMNWQIADLDGKSILSFSDAHSPAKMGREATVFEADEASYDSIYGAIVGKWEVGDGKLDNEVRNEKSDISLQSEANPASHIPPRIAFTIEFHPEEGKYHFTGHRDCNYSQEAKITREKGTKCPVCNRPLTVGVMDRVEELAKNQVSSIKYQVSANGVRWVYPDGSGRPPYVSLVPLSEILAEALSSGADTKKVMDTYMLLVNQLGSEFNVLLKADLKEIERYSSQKVAEGIEKVRNGNIVVEPGYDGKFGVVKIWQNSQELEEKKQTKDDKQEESQLNLFA